MELPKIEKIETQDLDRWFSTLSDNLNYNLEEIEKALPLSLGTNKNLSTVDTAPIQYLQNALDHLVENLNKSFSGISAELGKINKRLDSMDESKKGA